MSNSEGPPRHTGTGTTGTGPGPVADSVGVGVTGGGAAPEPLFPLASAIAFIAANNNIDGTVVADELLPIGGDFTTAEAAVPLSRSAKSRPVVLCTAQHVSS